MKLERRLIAVAFALMLVLPSCQQADGTELQSPVHGVLTRLELNETGDVVAFTLKADDGRSWEFTFQPEPGASVPANHLQIHVDRALPVRVPFHGQGSFRTAYRIDDG